MTSKHLFLKRMREDLRHKVWMLALSLLCSFLAMPVIWLLRYSTVDLTGARLQITDMSAQEYAAALGSTVDAMAEFFAQELMLSSSIVAILAAVVVGLESFQYLQQKSTVDTYHSLPVSRTQLFGVKYLSGLLIWLVPCLFCTVLTLLLSGALLAQVGGGGGIFRLMAEAGKNILVLVIAFLLVYHTMLLATMLTGNKLNTVTVAGILGCGVIAGYGLTVGFMAAFFQTYYARGNGVAIATYFSPLAAPVILTGSRIDENFQISDGLLPTAAVLLGVALLLGALAWLAYLKRPSERAGKGLELSWIAWPLRLAVSILGGMGGWVFFHFLVSRAAVAWCVFGALLTGIMTYGVLDVIFSMDFKAFFRHKWSMGASMVVMLLICVGFRKDWAGYDRYLPDQGMIREASIACNSYGNRDNASQILDGVRLTDAAQIHAFLERGIENVQGEFHITEDFWVEEAYWGDIFDRDIFCVRVTLENGRTYYRVYSYFKWDGDVVLPLLCSEEYADGAYRLTEEQIEACTNMRLTCGIGSDSSIEAVSEKGVIRELAESYNLDLSEQFETVISGQDRLVGQLTVKTQQGNSRIYTMDIYENMVHTLEAMEKNGIRTGRQPMEAADVTGIVFQVHGSRYWYRGDLSISPVERSIRGYFGVYPENLPEASGEEADSSGEPPVYNFSVTDPAEIARLLPLIQYSDRRHSKGVFTEGFVEDVCILDRQGTKWDVCLRQGTMPEELVRRFIEEAENG